MVAFWAIELDEKKAVTVQPPEGFVLNVQMAALDSEEGKRYVLKAETEGVDSGEKQCNVLCTLRPVTVENVKLDLVFGWDVPTTFQLVGGPGKVHLTGYFQPGPVMEDMPEEQDDCCNDDKASCGPETCGQKRQAPEPVDQTVKRSKSETLPKEDGGDSSSSSEGVQLIRQDIKPSMGKNKKNKKRKKKNKALPLKP